MEVRAEEVAQGIPPAADANEGLFGFTVGVSRDAARLGAQALNWLADYGVPAAAEEDVPIEEEEEEPPAPDEMARGRWLLHKLAHAVNVLRGWVLSAPLYAICYAFVFALGLGVGLGVWASSPSSVVVRMPLDAGVGGGLQGLDFPRIGNSHDFNVDRSGGPFGQFLQTRQVSEGNSSSVMTFIILQLISPLTGPAPAPEPSARNTDHGSRSQSTKTLGNDTPTSKPARKAWKFWPSRGSSVGEDLASGAWV